MKLKFYSVFSCLLLMLLALFLPPTVIAAPNAKHPEVSCSYVSPGLLRITTPAIVQVIRVDRILAITPYLNEQVYWDPKTGTFAIARVSMQEGRICVGGVSRVLLIADTVRSGGGGTPGPSGQTELLVPASSEDLAEALAAAQKPSARQADGGAG